MALTPQQIEFRRQMAALYKQAGLTQPSPAAIRFYEAKGPAGLEILRQNLRKDPRTTFAQEDRLKGMVDTLLPKPVSETELSDRFGALYDPAFAQEETDLTQDIAKRTARFGEDAATADRRRSEARALTFAQQQEQLAAGGGSGTLAEQQTARRLQPYDQAAQDAAVQSSRFGTDITEEEQRRRLGIRQRKSTERAKFLSDPENKYEFSF